VYLQGIFALHGQQEGQEDRDEKREEQGSAAEAGNGCVMHVLGLSGDVHEAEAPGETADQWGEEQSPQEGDGEGDQENDHLNSTHPMW
jgi:hypothetical protein